jgi:hypothetical protein
MRFTRVVFVTALLALVVAPVALAIRFTDESYSPPAGETGKPYPNWSFTGAGGCGPALPYQYRLLGSAPPPGLTIDKGGLVHGTPTQVGDFSFWLELSDENPPSQSWCIPKTAERQFTIKILAGLSINQRQGSLGGAAATVPYSYQLTATGPGVWSVVAGALPAGVTLDSNTGLIAGTPAATGDFSFKIQIKDTSNRTDAQTYTLAVVQKLAITQPPLARFAEIGLPFHLALQATGGRPPYTWSATGLPAGFTLDQATGAINGVPGAIGTAPVKVTVTDALRLTSTADVNLSVAAKLALAKTLKPAKVGKAYGSRVVVTGGVKPIAFRIVSGKLPAGISLDRTTGKLSGTPRKAGTSRFAVQARDNLGQVVRGTLLLKVSA